MISCFDCSSKGTVTLGGHKNYSSVKALSSVELLSAMRATRVARNKTGRSLTAVADSMQSSLVTHLTTFLVTHPIVRQARLGNYHPAWRVVRVVHGNTGS